MIKNLPSKTFSCLQITFEDDSSKKQFPISIRQKDGSRKIELDEDQRSYGNYIYVLLILSHIMTYNKSATDDFVKI